MKKLQKVVVAIVGAIKAMLDEAAQYCRYEEVI